MRCTMTLAKCSLTGATLNAMRVDFAAELYDDAPRYDPFPNNRNNDEGGLAAGAPFGVPPNRSLMDNNDNIYGNRVREGRRLGPSSSPARRQLDPVKHAEWTILRQQRPPSYSDADGGNPPTPTYRRAHHCSLLPHILARILTLMTFYPAWANSFPQPPITDNHKAAIKVRHCTNRSARVSMPLFLLLALLGTTSHVDAVKSGGHICCACRSCEERWFSDGWICRATFLAQMHPDARWMSTCLRGSTHWHLSINNEYGTTIYNYAGQHTHYPDEPRAPECTHPPLSAPALDLNTCSSASGNISLGDIEAMPLHYGGNLHGTLAQCSTTTRLSPRFCLFIALLLSCALDTPRTDYLLRCAQFSGYNWRPMASLSRALRGFYAQLISWCTIDNEQPAEDTPLEQQNKQRQITHAISTTRSWGALARATARWHPKPPRLTKGESSTTSVNDTNTTFLPHDQSHDRLLRELDFTDTRHSAHTALRSYSCRLLTDNGPQGWKESGTYLQGWKHAICLRLLQRLDTTSQLLDGTHFD